MKHSLGVRIAGAPDVRIVGVDRLVGGQPLERASAQLLERAIPAPQAAQQLCARVAATSAGFEALALQRALLGLDRPRPRGPARKGDRRRSAGGVR
jgi:hypothetical protein